MKYVILAVEDDLSEAVLRRLIAQVGTLQVHSVLGRTGKGYLQSNAPRLNQAARGVPVICLTDLDREDCAPGLVGRWVPNRNEHFLLRVAVTEVEAWLLADREGMAEFLSVSEARLPRQAEALVDPKEHLINIARRSRKRSVREAIVPEAETTAKQGIGYNAVLALFVARQWDVAKASRRAPSLKRTVQSIRRLVRLLRGEPD